MRINDIVNSKGSSVVTARSDQSVAELVTLLTHNGIGAAVVTDDANHVTGIASERDIVRALAEHGATVLDQRIADIMTSEVHTCTMDDELEPVATSMTTYRIRHVPVIADGELAAIVSIGDIVKSRIDQLQAEREHLVNYLHG